MARPTLVPRENPLSHRPQTHAAGDHPADRHHVFPARLFYDGQPANAEGALKASLPTATQITSTAKPDMIKLKVDSYGQPSVDDRVLTFPELDKLLAERLRVNTNVPVYLSGSRKATHGMMVYVLDRVKRAGVQRVAFAVKADLTPSAPTP
jgi:biopolymer transport protein ExbD